MWWLGGPWRTSGSRCMACLPVTYMHVLGFLTTSFARSTYTSHNLLKPHTHTPTPHTTTHTPHTPPTHTTGWVRRASSHPQNISRRLSHSTQETVAGPGRSFLALSTWHASIPNWPLSCLGWSMVHSCTYHLSCNFRWVGGFLGSGFSWLGYSGTLFCMCFTFVNFVSD